MIKDKIIEILRDIIDYITYNPCGIRSFIEKVKGTCAYTAFIWRENCYREWDYDYLYSLIEFKLKRMAIQLHKDNFVVDSEERVKEINKALSCLNIYRRLMSSNYQLNGIDYVRELHKQQQDAWRGFHDTLKEHGQGWWS